jgi:transposase
MKRFIQGESRTQSTLLPAVLDDYIAETNPVRVVDVFVDELTLGRLGFTGIEPAATGRPAYHPAVLLKLYIYGYLNRIPSSRRLEREAQRNVELMWLTGRLMPDHKTIANFRRSQSWVSKWRLKNILSESRGVFESSDPTKHLNRFSKDLP